MDEDAVGMVDEERREIGGGEIGIGLEKPSKSEPHIFVICVRNVWILANFRAVI